MSAVEASLPVAGRRRNLIEGAWALVGQVGSGLVLLVGTRLITELVPPSVFGEVALFNGLVGLGVTLLAYPFISAGVRLLPEYAHRGRKSLLIAGLERVMGRAIFLACLLLALGAMVYVGWRGADAWPFLAAIPLLIVTMRRELGIQLLIGERRQREASLWQTADSLLRPLITISLVLWLGARTDLILLSYCLAGLSANLAGARFHRRPDERQEHVQPQVLRSAHTDILRFALPLIPMELLSWFNALGDRYVIGYFMTAEDVGLYAAAYTLTNEAFHRAAIVLLRTFQPVYFGHHSHGRRQRAFKTFALWTLAIVSLGVGGVTALMLLKDWVAGLLLAPVYRAAADLMPVIGIGCALQALGTVAAQPLYARKTTRRLLIGRGLGALTAAVALPLMVRAHGLMGAAWAAPIYFGVEAGVMALVARFRVS
jgi:O-antigen/teichoic acid export membrane protein